MFFFTPRWKTLRDSHLKERDVAIQRGRDLLAEHGGGDDLNKADGASLDAEILRQDIAGLTKGIEERRWDARRVLRAFIRSSIRAQERTNCLTEVLYQEAYEEATKLDDHFAETGQLKGPLHGVPFSFKDQYGIRGVHTTLGFINWITSEPVPNLEEEAVLVKIVRAAGGVPFVKTNVPQCLLAYECSNPLFGVTSNPWSAAHTSGGSSGGEAALLGCDGSAAGFGSDIGGSLRIPTAWCGTWSLKGSSQRWPNKGVSALGDGLEGVKSVLGPMGRSLADVRIVTQLVFDYLHSSPASAPGLSSSTLTTEPLLPLPFRDIDLPDIQKGGRPLRFGYYINDGFIRASPACKRAVEMSVNALTKAGHECVEIEIPSAAEALHTFVGLTSSDGYYNLTRHIGGEGREPALFLPVLVARIPAFLRNFVAFIVRRVVGDVPFATAMSGAGAKSARQYWSYVQKRNHYIQRFKDEVWIKHGLDGIIAPTNALPAMPHGATKELSMAAIGTIIYNITDATVGIVPVRRVSSNLDEVSKTWRSAGPEGSKLATALMYDSGKYYDPHRMKNLPVGVQVIGQEWEEEKVLKMMEVLDRALGPRDLGYPGAWIDAQSQQA